MLDEHTYLEPPLPGFLSREIDNRETAALIAKFSPYLQELCNLATNAFGRAEKSAKKEGGTPLSLLFLYYHIIQMADGVEVLTSRNCFQAATPLLRSLLEGSLSLEYMLHSNSGQRSTAWMAEQRLKELEYYECLLQDTARGKQFRSSIRKDRTLKHSGLQFPPAERVRADHKRIEVYLSQPKFSAAIDALRDGKAKHWYELDHGPTSMEQVAQLLSRDAEYQELYREYSTLVHAGGFDRMARVVDGRPVYSPIRCSEGGETIYLLTSHWLIEATRMVLAKFRPEECVMNQVRRIVERYRPEILSNWQE